MNISSRPVDAPLPVDLAFFQREGFLVFRKVFSLQQIAEVTAEAEGLLARRDLICTDNIRCRWQNHIETSECLFDCFDPVSDVAPAIERLARDPHLLGILSTIYAEEACLLKRRFDVQTTWCGRLRLAPRLYFLAHVPEEFHNRHRSSRSFRC